MRNKLVGLSIIGAVAIVIAFWLGIKTAEAAYLGPSDLNSVISHDGKLYAIGQRGIYAILIPIELEPTSDGVYKMKYGGRYK